MMGINDAIATHFAFEAHICARFHLIALRSQQPLAWHQLLIFQPCVQKNFASHKYFYYLTDVHILHRLIEKKTKKNKVLP